MRLVALVAAWWFGTSVAVTAAISAALSRRPRTPQQPQPWTCPDSVAELFAEIGAER